MDVGKVFFWNGDGLDRSRYLPRNFPILASLAVPAPGVYVQSHALPDPTRGDEAPGSSNTRMCQAMNCAKNGGVETDWYHMAERAPGIITEELVTAYHRRNNPQSERGCRLALLSLCGFTAWLRSAIATKERKTCGDGVAGEGLVVSGNPCGKGKCGNCPATVLEAPAFPSIKLGVADDPGGAFTPATVLEPAKESTSGGLERALVTKLLLPVT